MDKVVWVIEIENVGVPVYFQKKDDKKYTWTFTTLWEQAKKWTSKERAFQAKEQLPMSRILCIRDHLIVDD